MIDSDAESTAIVTAQSIKDDRVQHFYDPDKLVGKTFGQRLGRRDVIAWDMYMFFPIGNVWRWQPPMPSAWAHQMGEEWPEHYRWEEDLVMELNRIAAGLK